MTPEQEPLPPVAPVNRSRGALLLPLAIGLLVVFGMAAATASLTPTGAGIVANFMFSVMCLFPAIICLFVGYIAVVAAIYGLHVVNQIAAAQMKKADESTEKLAERVAQSTENINKQMVEVSVLLAKLDPIFSLFEREAPADDPNNETTGNRNHDGQ